VRVVIHAALSTRNTLTTAARGLSRDPAVGLFRIRVVDPSRAVSSKSSGPACLVEPPMFCGRRSFLWTLQRTYQDSFGMSIGRKTFLERADADFPFLRCRQRRSGDFVR